MTVRKFSHYRLGFAFVCLTTAFPSPAQSPAKPRHLKNDQLLTQALAENGLGTDVSSPWHVRATFETFDERGKHKGDGTFEEWWAGPRNYKSVFTSEGFNQTDVATPAGLFRSGDKRWVDNQEDLVQKLLISPLSVHPYDPRHQDLIDESRANGAFKMRCVFLLGKPMHGEPAGGNLNADLNQVPSYCFEPDSALLRCSSTIPGYLVVFNDVVHLRSHYVARSIQKMGAGKSFLTIRVLEADALPPDIPAFTAPPGSSGPLGGRIQVPEELLDVVGGRLGPPPSAMRDLDSADFSVQIVIGKDGHVIDATTITAPPGLADATAKSLRKLIFAPFTILDTPVEVETTIHWHFSSSQSVTIVDVGRP